MARITPTTDPIRTHRRAVAIFLAATAATAMSGCVRYQLERASIEGRAMVLKGVLSSTQPQPMTVATVPTSDD